ncbi:unnamed protein product, partial [Mesorhabditis belari]|uniref:glucuronosyltransferase n=1 Tax=Mesorhabditis belari TaxID=2138241 RepID=A0AAF3FPC0_9BILA
MRFWILLCFVINAISASKIAIFTFEHSNSQAIFNNKLAIALADGGHEVLLVRPVVNSKLTVESLIHAQIKTFTPNNGYDYEIYRPFEDVKIKHMFRNSSIFEGFEMSSTFFDLSMHICNNTLSDQALIKHLKEEKIDLAFHHHMDFCQMALIQHLNISDLPPYPALLNSAGQFVPTSVLPSYVLQTGNEMSFLQRSLNHFVEFLNGHLRLSKQADGQTELARRLLGNHITNLIDFPKTANLVMLSGDPIIEFPIPTTRKVVYIGGLGTRKETKELPKEFENFITDAEKVVVISFGSWTVAKHMPKFWKDALIQLFKNHPKIRFVWSCEENLVLPPNAFRASWIPQDSLLANNKSILLITHAGYNSLMEAVQHGIPTIAIPLFSFGDQARNAHLFKKHGTTRSPQKRVSKNEHLASNTLF